MHLGSNREHEPNPFMEEALSTQVVPTFELHFNTQLIHSGQYLSGQKYDSNQNSGDEEGGGQTWESMVSVSWISLSSSGIRAIWSSTHAPPDESIRY